MRELMLYIHIPFCVKKCDYCDFLSAPAGEQVQNAYMENLIREIREKSKGRLLPANAEGQLPKSVEVHLSPECAGEGGGTPGECPVTSIFIGGGTPSVVKPEWIRRVMDAVRECYEMVSGAEITMEVNPGTVTPEALRIYREAGINRLSIGCQSTDDESLVRIGRIHDFAQFLDTYYQAREAGFDNINVDLMNALPGQSLADAQRNVETILSLTPPPEHISVYSLILEENTKFHELWEQGTLILPDEDLEREMYWRTAEILKNSGYEHYEISNFAKAGYRCRHNLGYWERREYLGFGLGAASLYGGMRFANLTELNRYGWLADDWAAKSIGQPERSGQETGTVLPWQYAELENLTREDSMAETMFLGLRTADGVDEARFAGQYGRTPAEIYPKEITQCVEQGLMEKKAGRLVLTARGLDISNYVMAKFLPDLENG